ncbi:MAG TPA: hypothetical protein VFE51_31230 [Verrucomicrobiae bacterium]|nr:hypothetical protein [Verrucomicrobiae bacterium]
MTATQCPALAIDRSKPAAPQPSLRPRKPAAAHAEVDAPKLLYPGFSECGAGILWRDFESAQPVNWSRGFQPGSLELCLNLAGRAALTAEGKSARLEPLSAAFYIPRAGKFEAWRDAGQRHQFLTLQLRLHFAT